MRVSREVAALNRERVVEKSSEAFRSHGYDGIGVANLMKTAGMTHGGFYKQFKDKDALAAEATDFALRSNFDMWKDVMDRAKGDPFDALRKWYLAPVHVQAPAGGCTFATLGAEAPRHGPALQEVFEAAIDRQIADLEARHDGTSDARTHAIQTMAQMIGAIILARSVKSEALRDEILEAGRSAATTARVTGN